MLTFHAATARKDSKGYLQKFQMKMHYQRRNNQRDDDLGSFSNFEKKKKGSLEVGKWADLVIYDKDLMKVSSNS
jgi:predicted amidohydrolase YtcJ